MRTIVNITDNNFSEAIKEEMWTVYQQYYNYSKVDFMERINRNNHFALYTNGGRIVGFTGLRIDRIKVGKKSRLMIYFGQTVIDKKFRGKALLPITGAKLCFKYLRELIFSNIYIWCDALTYKSYLVVAKTLSDFYPSYKNPTPGTIKSLIDYIGQSHYKENYCQQLGTVCKSTNLVSDPSSRVYDHDKKDADIQFYMQANPNYLYGHGLITLAPINGRNFFMLLQRFINKL